MKALIIGGTGPTGPHIIRGLLDRGYDVTMLNRGVVTQMRFRQALSESSATRTLPNALRRRSGHGPSTSWSPLMAGFATLPRLFRRGRTGL